MVYKIINPKIMNLIKTNIVAFSAILIYRLLYTFYNQMKRINISDAFKIQKMKNKYKGRRCFIIGNGPSLNKTNLKLLKNEITFGLNRIYINFEKMGFYPTFLVSINRLLLKQCWKEIKDLPIKKFVPYTTRTLFGADRNTIYINTYGQLSFSEDVFAGLCEGSTVTYVALQLAYFMGFSEVILIGVDHNFVTQGKPNSVVYQKNGDPNHFSAKYFKGMKWQLPDLETSELAYRLAKYHFNKDGRRVLDATVGGKLNVFNKVPYLSLFRSSQKE